MTFMRMILVKSFLRTGFCVAFTFVELLVVMTIISILAAVLLPALNKAKQRAYIVECVSNLHQIGIGLKMYVDENQDTFPPVDARCFLGGIDGTNSLMGPLPAATNRLLAPYVPGSETFHCPADRGTDGGFLRPSVFGGLGCSYQFSTLPWHSYLGIAEDVDHNLCLKKESWPPDPARFITMHEWGAYPQAVWDLFGGVNVVQWHNASHPGQVYESRSWIHPTIQEAPEKFVAPVLFVDGHSQQCDFTTVIKSNQFALLTRRGTGCGTSR